VRALVLDELRKADLPRLRAYLEDRTAASPVEDLYWVELAEDLLTEEQAGHGECRPHRFAVELGPDYLRLEFLIRPASGLRCSCCGYATEEQRRFILSWADNLVEDLALST